jgi:peptide/nickel transport system permease protein
VRGERLAWVLLALWALTSLLAPWLAPRPFEATELSARLEPPSASHWLGTDELGRDLLSRLLYGGRVSLAVSAAAVAAALLVGGLAGTFSGYRGGWVDLLMGRGVDILMAMPGLLLAIVVVAYVGRGLGPLVLALSATAWVGYARLARARALSLRNQPFVEAARAQGAGEGRLLVIHLLPNVAPLLLVQSAAGAAGVILTEAGLSFLGLGIQPPRPSWGGVLAAGCDHLLEAPHLALAPGILLFAVVWALNRAGEGLAERLDPRRRHLVGTL